MDKILARSALMAARKHIAEELDELIDGFTVGGPIGRARGEPMSGEGEYHAAPIRRLLRKIDRALGV